MADSGEFFDPAELVTYVKHLLTEETSSRNHESRGTPQRLVDIAEAIAAQSGPSFVAAGIAARSYAATGHNDSQLLPLDRGLAGLVESELNRVYPNRSRRRSAVAILAVAAAAFGPGMAWGDVWPAAAAAVVPSGASGLDDDIQELVHGDLGRWVQRTLNSDGSTVYRIADESLREAILRLDSFGAVVERPNETGYLTELHRAITRGLQPLLHRKTLMGESLPPPAYARRYIADHAAAGGILSLLLADAMSLPDVHPMIAERAKSLSPAQRTAPLHPDTVSQSPTANSNDHATDSAGESATRQLVSQGALERSAALRPAKSGSTPRLSGAKPSGLLIASAAIGTIAVSLVTGALLWRGNASGGDAPSTQVPSGSIPTVLVTTTVVQQADPTAVQQADPNTVTVQEIPPTTTVVMTVPTTVVLTTTVVITTTVPGPVEVAPEGEVIVPSLNLPSLSVPLLPITPVVTAPG